MKGYFLARPFFTLDESPQDATRIQKWIARHLWRVPFMFGRCENWPRYSLFYLCWCDVHKIHYLTYPQTYSYVTPCAVCEAERSIEVKLDKRVRGKGSKSARRKGSNT